eukprot:4987155-Prymnesium_polylepis.1
MGGKRRAHIRSEVGRNVGRSMVLGLNYVALRREFILLSPFDDERVCGVCYALYLQRYAAPVHRCASSQLKTGFPTHAMTALCR